MKSYYNIIMKKILAFFIIICFTLPANAAFWNRKNKALEAEMQGKGYAGTLPNLESKNQKKQEKVAKPIFESQKSFDEPKELKPVPQDNPAFIDIISKKDRTSEYVIDVKEMIPILEKLVDSIEENQNNVQLFVTRANVVSMNIDHLMSKYDGQPESYYESFKKMLELNRYVKSIALLRREAITYQRYLAYQSSGSIYNPENINQQLQYLLEELNNTILLLKQEI